MKVSTTHSARVKVSSKRFSKNKRTLIATRLSTRVKWCHHCSCGWCQIWFETRHARRTERVDDSHSHNGVHGMTVTVIMVYVEGSSATWDDSHSHHGVRSRFKCNLAAANRTSGTVLCTWQVQVQPGNSKYQVRYSLHNDNLSTTWQQQIPRQVQFTAQQIVTSSRRHRHVTPRV